MRSSQGHLPSPIARSLLGLYAWRWAKEVCTTPSRIVLAVAGPVCFSRKTKRGKFRPKLLNRLVCSGRGDTRILGHRQSVRAILLHVLMVKRASSISAHTQDTPTFGRESSWARIDSLSSGGMSSANSLIVFPTWIISANPCSTQTNMREVCRKQP